MVVCFSSGTLLVVLFFVFVSSCSIQVGAPGRHERVAATLPGRGEQLWRYVMVVYFPCGALPVVLVLFGFFLFILATSKGVRQAES